MPSFTTRVELHDATASDYDDLHDQMERRGFSRVIEGAEGKMYRLPTAEYDFFGDYSRDNVRDKAAAAVRAIDRRGMILVTESAGRCWSGLSRV